MRSYDRGPLEIRPCVFELDYIKWPLGSVLCRFGQTAVLCNAAMEARVPTHCDGEKTGWITAEYAMLPQAGNVRSTRDGRPAVRGRTQEIQRFIGRSLRAGINLAWLRGHTMTCDCDVLSADGGTRTAALTGAWLAVRLALHRFFSGNTPVNLFRDPFMAAISAGVVDGVVYVDLDYSEDARAEIDLNLVATGNGLWVEVQGTSESEPRSRELMVELMDAAGSGIQTLVGVQKQVLAKKGIAP